MQWTFKAFVALVACLTVTANEGQAQQLTPGDLERLTPTILQLCLHPDRKGEILRIEGDAKAGADVLFKVVDLGISGKTTYEKWNGISIALDKYGDSPRLCAVEILKLIVPEPPKKQSREDEAREGEAMIVALNSRDHEFEDVLRKIRNVNARSASGARALAVAAYRTDQAKLRLLLQHGADPNLLDEEMGEPPLNRAITQYNNMGHFRHQASSGSEEISKEDLCTRWEVEKIQIVEALRARGAKFAGPIFRGGWTPLMTHAAADECPMLELGRMLIRFGAEVNAVYSGRYSNNSALLLAVEDGFPQTVDQLLRAGADPNVRGHFGRTALVFLAERSDILHDGTGHSFRLSYRTDCWDTDNGNTLKFKYLLRSKADVTLRDEDGKSPEDYLRQHLKGGCKTANCNGKGRNGWGRCYERMLGYLTGVIATH